jgi:GxxExxY protein
MAFEPIPAEVEELATQTVDAAFKVHKELGPGLLESVYEVCLVYELSKKGLKAVRQLELPVVYQGVQLDAGLRLDILVEDQLIVEVKAVEKFAPVHQAQLMTYLKLTNRRLGLLINFNVPLIKQGIKRVIL